MINLIVLLITHSMLDRLDDLGLVLTGKPATGMGVGTAKNTWGLPMQFTNYWQCIGELSGAYPLVMPVTIHNNESSEPGLSHKLNYGQVSHPIPSCKLVE
jgi:hypothetical protein